MLDRIQDESMARDLLKLTTRKQVGEKGKRKEYALLWETSPMDEAVDPSAPCYDFVAHTHCQNLLDLTFCGHYGFSRCRINEPDQSLFLVFLQARAAFEHSA